MSVAEFFPAEEDHQRYLKRHPCGYRHMQPELIAEAWHLQVDPGRYILLEDGGGALVMGEVKVRLADFTVLRG